MSNRAMDDFTEAVRREEGIARGLIFALAGKQGGEIVEAFVAYANACGFDVIGSDVGKLRQEAGRSAVSAQRGCPERRGL